MLNHSNRNDAGRQLEQSGVTAGTTRKFEALVKSVEKRLSGVLGFAAAHLETGITVSVNGRERFPMASTYKIPMAGLLLQMVDNGQLSLDQRVEIEERHFEETGDIAQSVCHPGVALSIANLVELMLTQSNNNATDRVLELIGGPRSVTEWLRAIGIADMRVDNSVNSLLGKFYGLQPGEPAMKSYLAKWATDAERERINGLPQLAFDDGVEDMATPDAMLSLLRTLFATELLSQDSRAFLNSVMTRCQTGSFRIKGMLPPEASVAHKTGTIGGTVNDVGIITLPGDCGRVALAIYTKKSPILPYSSREPLLAEVARSVYDFFVLADLDGIADI